MAIEMASNSKENNLLLPGSFPTLTGELLPIKKTSGSRRSACISKLTSEHPGLVLVRDVRHGETLHAAAGPSTQLSVLAYGEQVHLVVHVVQNQAHRDYVFMVATSVNSHCFT